ncbi:MAG: hypothetical protein KJO42_12295 [Silicimonas sp.]|nr:hypothetical protein [Silicimonas sp.]MBT8425268.1 hypothetical protein [Silicimonas sp.]NND20267.1 hypothetical protein [Silicimonas sp.]NND42310.1 hypothetical protein [Silicimonas sp.]NNL74217.1 hypothetical protein [Silicimonas sp.]
MTNEWMLDVLADLRTFSIENGLDVTGKQIDLVMAVAAAEITSVQGTAHSVAQQGVGDVGRLYREATERGNS